MPEQSLPGGVTETTATVADGHNALDLRLSKQTFIEVLRDGYRVMRAATAEPKLTISIPPGTYTIRTDGAVTPGASRDASAPATAPVTIEALRQSRLLLSSDAAKQHEIDGIACIPADGHSFITVTVQQAATAAGGSGGTQTVYLRSTGGKLMDEKGEHAIRSVGLQGGTAKFRLVAEAQPSVATVWVLNGPPPQRASLDVEFTPV